MVSKIKKSSSKGAIATIDKTDYGTGLKFRVGITNPDYADVGDLTPAKIRAINIKKGNAILQEEWANEWLEGVKQLESTRKAIEKIRAEIEKTHFRSEADIDEYVLGALLAKTEYDAHFKEWTARKNRATKYINGGADEEIKVVSQEFADRIRLRKAKNDQRILASKEKTDAEIAEIGKSKDRTDAVAAAQAKARLKAFMRGDPMDQVNAIGGGIEGAITVSARSGDLPLLDAITSGNFFNFK